MSSMRYRTLAVILILLGGLAAGLPLLAQEMAPARDIPKTEAEAIKANKEVKAETKSNIYQQLDLFGEAFERVREDYVDEVTSKELIEAAINGMLTHLDPHSSYLNEEGLEDITVQTKGEFGGLGIEVTMENGFIKVVSPIDDTPAFNAGVKAGDYITHLDGKAVVGMTLSEAVDMMRGKIGTSIELTVRREGEAKALKFKVTRAVITIKSVKSEIMGDIAYVRISSFNNNTDSGVKDAIDAAKKKLGSRLRGVVLDLRNNPGGLLNQAIAVSDLFLEQGEIVSTRGRHESDTKRDMATAGDVTEGMPLVVLINGGSASASEIVSGALQDHRRAVLMGTKSFGKGSVQTIIQIPDHGALRLTTARYYTPSGRSIQATGIEPDITVEPAKIEKIEDEEDGLIKESELQGALKAEKTEQEKVNAEEEAKNGEDLSAIATHTDELAKGDYQLARALDLVRGMSLYRENLSTPAGTVAVPAPPAGEEEAKAKDEKERKAKGEKPVAEEDKKETPPLPVKDEEQ